MAETGATSADVPPLFSLLNPREDVFGVFLHLLWEKTAGRGHHQLMDVRIPDTVMLNHSRAIHWYFTAKDGTIKMKSKKRLSAKVIIEHFGRSKDTASKASTVLIHKQADHLVGMAPHMKGELHQVLGDGRTTGLLQTFVEPKQDHPSQCSNHLIVASWTPNVLYVEKRVNILDMRSDKHTLEERTTLADDCRFVSAAPLVSVHTTNQIEKICHAIAAHVEVLHGCKLTNIVLHLKVDVNNVPWVLYCTSLRATHVSPSGVPLSASVTAAPPSAASQAPAGGGAGDGSGATPAKGTVTLRKKVPTPAERSLRSNSSFASHADDDGLCHEEHSAFNLECDLCRTQIEHANAQSLVAKRHVLFPLNVLSFFNANPPGTLYSEAVVDGKVPAAVLMLHPAMTWAQYRRAHRDSRWQNERVSLCAACAAGLESVTNNLHIDSDGAIRVPATTHPLTTMKHRPPPAPEPTPPPPSDGRKPPVPRRSASRPDSRASELPPLAPRRTPTPDAHRAR